MKKLNYFCTILAAVAFSSNAMADPVVAQTMDSADALIPEIVTLKISSQLDDINISDPTDSTTAERTAIFNLCVFSNVDEAFATVFTTLGVLTLDDTSDAGVSTKLC